MFENTNQDSPESTESLSIQEEIQKLENISQWLSKNKNWTFVPAGFKYNIGGEAHDLTASNYLAQPLQKYAQVVGGLEEPNQIIEESGQLRNARAVMSRLIDILGKNPNYSVDEFLTYFNNDHYSDRFIEHILKPSHPEFLDEHNNLKLTQETFENFKKLVLSPAIQSWQIDTNVGPDFPHGSRLLEKRVSLCLQYLKTLQAIENDKANKTRLQDILREYKSYFGQKDNNGKSANIVQDTQTLSALEKPQDLIEVVCQNEIAAINEVASKSKGDLVN
ncbi:MAG: hypothetical protein WCK98_01340 [bacterium]